MKKILIRVTFLAALSFGCIAHKPDPELLIKNSKQTENKVISQVKTKNTTTMANPEYIDAVDKYLKALNEKDLKGILALYAENATVEDPVGSTVVSGKANLREFYTGAVNIDLVVTRTGPVRIAGKEIAFPFQLQMKVKDTLTITDIIDVFRFNTDGKIVSMRAFHGPHNRRIVAE